jgi:diaminopimelate decarboxylase
MVASNELDYSYMVETTRMLLDIVSTVSEALDIRFEFINIGGGLGIPYRPDQKPLDIEALGRECTDLIEGFSKTHGWCPKMFMESGRLITGPHGALVTTVINHKEIYRKYVGVDASMSSLMRPGMYDTYHHIHVHGKDEATQGQSQVPVRVKFRFRVRPRRLTWSALCAKTTTNLPFSERFL